MKINDINKAHRFNEHTDQDLEHYDTLQKTGFWGKRGAGCFAFNKETGKFLLLHRSRIVEQPNTWGLAGGAIDQNEEPLKAAIREFKEETRFSGEILDSMLLYLYQDDESGFQYFNYLIVVDAEFTPVLNWENSDYKWFELGEWPSPLHFGVKELLSHSSVKDSLKKVLDKYSNQ